MQKNLESLQQRNREWIETVNRGDVEAYAALLTEDAVWFPPDGDPIIGRKAFKQWLVPFFERYTYNFDISKEGFNIAGNRAIEKASFVSKMTPKRGGEPMQHTGTFMALWLLEKDGIWRIERYIDDTEI